MSRLEKIALNVRSGTLSCGIVGLSKAGKSTTLNALLGCDFLPTGFEPETAVTVIILHNSSALEGNLYQEKQGNLELLRSGCKNISDYLYGVNADVRNKQEKPPKLILHAPILFLSHFSNEITVKFSDTPGLSEVTVVNSTITADAQTALKDLFAYVLIMNLAYLKSEDEVKLLHTLEHHHPQLWSKLDRNLILINRYELAYSDRNDMNLRPENIAQYVSDFLAKPNVLNLTIPPEHILPYSALWGLKAHKWQRNLSALTEIDFDESINELVTAGVIDESIGKTISKEDVILNIKQFSKIESVENELKEMLQTHGPRILLEAAVDDSKGILLSVNGTIFDKKKELLQELDNIQGHISIHKEILSHLSKCRTAFDHDINQLRNSLNSTLHLEATSLREVLEEVIEESIRKRFHGYDWTEDQQALNNKIEDTKMMVKDSVNERAQKSWIILGEKLRKVQCGQAPGILAKLGTTYGKVISLCKRCDVGTELEEQQQKLKVEIQTLKNVDMFVSKFPPNMDYELSSSSVSSTSLRGNFLSKTRDKIVRKYYEKETSYGFLWLGRRSVLVPYDTIEQYTVYGPDIIKLKHIFSNEGISTWITQFRTKAVNEIERMLSQFSGKATNTELISSVRLSIRTSLIDRENAFKHLQDKLAGLNIDQKHVENILAKLHE